MTVEFFDRQDGDGPRNGETLRSSTELRPLLDGLLGREPFFAELVGDGGAQLLLGIGPEACVQHSAVDGSCPYLTAVLPETPAGEAGDSGGGSHGSQRRSTPRSETRFCRAKSKESDWDMRR